jgi:hypothetical protein
MIRPLTTERITLILQTLEQMFKAKKFGGQGGLLPGDLRDDYLRLVDVYRVMQAGGAKAMLYRMETGHRLMYPDYFAEISGEFLSPEDRNLHWDGVSTASLSNLLRTVTASEEEAVARMSKELQEFLRSVKISHLMLDIPGILPDSARKLN